MCKWIIFVDILVYVVIISISKLKCSNVYTISGWSTEYKFKNDLTHAWLKYKTAEEEP